MFSCNKDDIKEKELWNLLDCLNLTDFGVECFYLGFAIVLIAWAVMRCVTLCRSIREAAPDDPVISQLRRSRRVHGSILVFLSTFTCDLVISIVLFWLVYKQQISNEMVDLVGYIYLLVMQTHIYVLDMVYLTIAYIYYKAFVCLGSIEREHNLDSTLEESRNQRFRYAKKILFGAGIFYLAALVVSAILFFSAKKDISPAKISNTISIILTLFSTLFIWILFGLFFRYAIKNLQLNKKAIRRQIGYIFLLSLSAIGRSVVNCIIEFGSFELRTLNDQCIDTSWHYSLFIFLFHFFANIVPVWVFMKAFSPSRQKNTSEVLKTLDEHTTDSIFIE